ncbi:MAG: hypothetical protein KatS3mg105_4439 [Gemmatales bacterium]|nr:MAG: hypothetical protein KatS3mg105_4439 [Gemmatales bacterium]
MTASLLLSFVFLVHQAGQVSGAGKTSDEQLKQAVQLIKSGKAKQALELLDRLIRNQPKNQRAYLLRGIVHEDLDEHKKAIADFTRVIELGATTADAVEAWNHRGSERFKVGDIAGSIADFDEYIKRKPSAEPGHWKRGISYYYAREFAKGRQQFRGYEKVDTNDVENAVWHYLCNAQLVGVEKARQQMLKIGNDRRIPMMKVYDLFKGRAKPEDVIRTAEAGNPPKDLLRRRLFYARLYLGLFYESQGDRDNALKYLSLAADEANRGVHHYMWDVARVHRDLLTKRR